MKADLAGQIVGWLGVVGNKDEMLTTPETLEEFAKRSPQLQSVWGISLPTGSAVPPLHTSSHFCGNNRTHAPVRHR